MRASYADTASNEAENGGNYKPIMDLMGGTTILRISG
jgi:hypothetical protein